MTGPTRHQETTVVQEALELRHDIEELGERCRRLYEEANDLVERLRRLRTRVPAPREAGHPTRSGAAAIGDNGNGTGRGAERCAEQEGVHI